MFVEHAKKMSFNLFRSGSTTLVFGMFIVCNN